jgi:predicted regulator of Ras-like GTPase activity (Roadblock/LC7/MglB family)
MAANSLVVLEEDHTRFITLLDRLREEANAKFAFLLDKSGQQIATAGALEGSDSTALASLAAGNVAATEGLAQIIGENEFSTLYHEGENDSIHISVVSNRIILLVVFDEHSSLGLVRLRVKQITQDLGRVLNELMNRSRSEVTGSAVSSNLFDEISDEDIDALFG